MKIVVDLPEWATENRQSIYIFSQGELVAKKEARSNSLRELEYGPLEVKTVRCNRCGKCCMNVNDNWVFGKDKNGDCTFLGWNKTDGFYCATAQIPWGCAKGHGKIGDECCIKFEAVE